MDLESFKEPILEENEHHDEDAGDPSVQKSDIRWTGEVEYGIKPNQKPHTIRVELKSISDLFERSLKIKDS